MDPHQPVYVSYPTSQRDFQFGYPPYSHNAQVTSYQYPPHLTPADVSQQQQQAQFFRTFRAAPQSIVSSAPPTQPLAAPPPPTQSQFRAPQAPTAAHVQSSSSAPNAAPEAGAGSAAEDDEQDDNDAADINPAAQPSGNDENGAPVFNIPPPPEDTYPSEEALEKAMHDWSKDHGYELVRRASKRNAKGAMYKRYYHCSKHGKRANTAKLTAETRVRHNRKSGRADCPMSLAAVAVDPTQPEGAWQIRHRKSHHNHPPIRAIELTGHRRRARMGAVEQTIDGLFAIGTSTAQVLSFLQRTNPEGLFRRTDVANMKNRWKKWGTCADRIQRSENKQGSGVGQVPQQDGNEDTTMTFNDNDAATGAADPIDLTTATSTTRQASNSTSNPQQAPGQAPTRPDSTQTQQIISAIQSFHADHVAPSRLSLESSAVEVLAQSSCGNGDSYKALPVLNTARDWPRFRDAMREASLRENTYDVLTGAKSEPRRPAAMFTADPGAAELEVDVETWNEYIRRLAIYMRRNALLLSALFGNKVGAAFKARLNAHPAAPSSARAAWVALEDWCEPKGSKVAFSGFCELVDLELQAAEEASAFAARLEALWSRLRGLRGELGLAVRRDARLAAATGVAAPSLEEGIDTRSTAGPGRRGRSAQNSRSQAAAYLDHNRVGIIGSANKTLLPDGMVSTSAPDLDRSPDKDDDPFPETLLALLFLRALAQSSPEWKAWVDGLCLTSNLAGFGTGDRLGWREIVRAAVRKQREWMSG